MAYLDTHQIHKTCLHVRSTCDFPDVQVGLEAWVYSCCPDKIMGAVCFQLKSALVWNVIYMWHVCAAEKQTDGNSATQWFMFGVQGSRHGGKRKEETTLQRFRRHSGIRWGNQANKNWCRCSFFVQGLPWSKQKQSECFPCHREMRSPGTFLRSKSLEHWRKANRDKAVSLIQ